MSRSSIARTRLLALALAPVCALILTSAAAAADPGWAVGAGVGANLDGPWGGQLGGQGLGGLGGGVGPRVEALVERRVSESIWLGLSLDGAISTSGAAGSGGGGAHHEAFSAGGRLSARYVFNPGQVVEVSGMTSVGYAYDSARSDAELVIDGEPAQMTSRATAHALTAGLGVALDLALVDTLTLSVASTLLEASWSHQRVEAFESASTADSLSAGLALRPWLGLRYAF